MPRPLRLLDIAIRPEWIDYNGHLNDAYYVLVFSRASDALMAHIGMDEDYVRASGLSLYTVEAHINYLREVEQGCRVFVTTQLLDRDAKRIRLFQTMYLEGGDEPLATHEVMLLHVEASGPRSADFPAPVAARIESIWLAHKQLPVPDLAGRSIAIGRR